MATTVPASRGRVWRALTEPRELAVWNPGRLAALDPAEGYPTPGRPVRWQCRLARVPVVLRECPVEVIPRERLRSALSLGPFAFEATYTLVCATGSQTQLGLRLVASNVIPVAGGVLDRFEVRRVAAQLVTETLEAFRSWIAAERPLPASGALAGWVSDVEVLDDPAGGIVEALAR